MLVGTSVQSKTDSTSNSERQGKVMGAHLVNVAERRCQQAFAEVFSYYAPRVKSYALKQVKVEAIALELVQETFTNVWQKAHLFDASKGSASTWIFTIARNIGFDLLRKQKSRKEDVCADDLWPVLCEQTADTSGLDLDQTMSLEEIQQAFGQLPDKQRLVLEAIYFEGKSQQEVADAMDVPIGTIKSRARLGLQRIRDILNSHD